MSKMVRLLPMIRVDFVELPRDGLVGHPCVYDWDKLKELVWPEPDGEYEIFVRKVERK